jgi:hypothetical protein
MYIAAAFEARTDMAAMHAHILFVRLSCVPSPLLTVLTCTAMPNRLLLLLLLLL